MISIVLITDNSHVVMEEHIGDQYNKRFPIIYLVQSSHVG